MSLPYYGGMRHIHTTPGSFDQACGEIRRLSDDEVGKVLDFIAELKAQRGEKSAKTVGDPDLLPRHAGKFSFNADEAETLLKMIFEIREAVGK